MSTADIAKPMLRRGPVFSNIEDMRTRARQNLPRMFFDYLDGGAFGERTLRRNIDDFDDWLLEQRVLVDLSVRDLGARFLGRDYPLPILLGPVGFAGMLWAGGEVAAARAARAAGIPLCLSTFSIASVEEVATVMPDSLALQLYVFKDRSLAEDLIARARAGGIETLFVTVDTDVSSIRERDTRNGFRTAARMSWRALRDMALHPTWSLRMALQGRPQLGNVRHRADLSGGLMAQAAYLSKNVDPSLSWRDLSWLRERWPGRLVIKGILSVDDAERAIASGADGLVVSNHGGRQLDGARSSISVLPEIAAHVRGRCEIFFDGGIRRGSHIVKALALGADAVMLGRAFAYGLAADGERGVTDAIALLRAEADITLALMGCTTIAQLREQGRNALRYDRRS